MPVAPARPMSSEATPPPAPIAAPQSPEPKPHRPKADANWTPRLIAPVEGGAAPAPEPVVSAPKPKKPADDFVPRLISPAPDAPKGDNDGDHSS